MFIWFIFAGIIAMCLVGFEVATLPVLLIGIGDFTTGILGTFGMYNYIKKTKEIQQTLGGLII